MKHNHLTAGRAALAAGILMTVGTQGEWVLNPQRDDGTIANMPVFAMLLLVATAGFTLLLTAALGIRRTTRGRRSRPGRVGSALTVAGAALLTLFGVSALVSALLTGRVGASAFLAFLLGMLVLAVGSLTWALSLRHQSAITGAWQTLLATGSLGLAALLIEPDPWHDVSLVGMFAGWSVLGILLLRAPEASRSARNAGTQTTPAV